MPASENDIVSPKIKYKQPTAYVYHWLNTETFDQIPSSDWRTLESVSKQHCPSFKKSSTSKRTKLFSNITSFFRTKNKNIDNAYLKINKSETTFPKKRGVFRKLLSNIFSNNSKRSKLAGLNWKVYRPDSNTRSSMENGESQINTIKNRGEVDYMLKRNKSDSAIFYKADYISKEKRNNNINNGEGDHINKNAKMTIKNNETNQIKVSRRDKNYTKKNTCNLKNNNNNNKVDYEKGRDTKRIKVKGGKRRGNNGNLGVTNRKSSYRKVKDQEKITENKLRVSPNVANNVCDNFTQTLDSLSNTKNKELRKQSKELFRSKAKWVSTEENSECVSKINELNKDEFVQTEFLYNCEEFSQNLIPGCTCSFNKNISTSKADSAHKEYCNPYTNINNFDFSDLKQRDRKSAKNTIITSNKYQTDFYPERFDDKSRKICEDPLKKSVYCSECFRPPRGLTSVSKDNSDISTISYRKSPHFQMQGERKKNKKMPIAMNFFVFPDDSKHNGNQFRMNNPYYEKSDINKPFHKQIKTVEILSKNEKSEQKPPQQTQNNSYNFHYHTYTNKKTNKENNSKFYTLDTNTKRNDQRYSRKTIFSPDENMLSFYTLGIDGCVERKVVNKEQLDNSYHSIINNHEKNFVNNHKNKNKIFDSCFQEINVDSFDTSKNKAYGSNFKKLVENNPPINMKGTVKNFTPIATDNYYRIRNINEHTIKKEMFGANQ